MKFLKVTTNGRVTIPASLRKKYKLTTGRRIHLIDDEDSIRIIPLATSEELKANIGFLGLKGKLLKALMEEKKREREF